MNGGERLMALKLPEHVTIISLTKMSPVAGIGDDDTDRGVTKSAKSRSSSVPAHKNRNTFSTPKPPSGECC